MIDWETAKRKEINTGDKVGTAIGVKIKYSQRIFREINKFLERSKTEKASHGKSNLNKDPSNPKLLCYFLTDSFQNNHA